jgi:hypothetical protein
MTDLHSIRQAIWRAEYIALKRECLAFDLLLDHWLGVALKRFNPAQARLPRGQPGGGRWTDEDGAGVILAAEDGRPIDLLEEEARGGHAVRAHVGKSEEYLISRAWESARGRNVVLAEGIRMGSFSSVEAAERLVNSTIAQNTDLVNQVVRGEKEGAQLYASFRTATGSEAYLRNLQSSAYMRET